MKTLANMADEYLEHLRAMRQRPQTLKRRRWELRRFARAMAENGVRTADDIRARHLQRWHKELSLYRTAKGTPLSASAVNGRIAAVRGLLRWLAGHGYVNRNLQQHLPSVKQPKVLPTSVLTHAQMRQLLTSIPTDRAEGYRDRAMLELMYSTGVRIGELLGLDVSHVDLKNRTMKVTGKGGKERVVPIGKTAARYVESYMVAVRPFTLKDHEEEALFLNRRGWRLRYGMFVRALHRCVKRSGLDVPVTAHTFRRSCTTELVRSEANLYHVKELLGHESLDTLNSYTKLTIVDLKKTHERCHPREKDAG